MEEFFVILQHVQLKNQSLHDSIMHFQNNRLQHHQSMFQQHKFQ